MAALRRFGRAARRVGAEAHGATSAEENTPRHRRAAWLPPIVMALAAVLSAASPAVAQPASPVATPTAEPEPFAAPGVDYVLVAEVPAQNPDDGYTLQLGAISMVSSSLGVERTSDDAEALTVEEGLVVFELIALEGTGRLINGGEGEPCGGEGCDLARFVGQEIVLDSGDTVTHGGPATYALRPAEVEVVADSGVATPEAMFATLASGRIVISHACGGGCR